jgi:hypothetical protein
LSLQEKIVLILKTNPGFNSQQMKICVKFKHREPVFNLNTKILLKDVEKKIEVIKVRIEEH